MQEKDYFSTKILENNNYLYGMFFRNFRFEMKKAKEIVALFRERITEDVLDKIVGEMPEEWLPSEENINMLKKYIHYRLNRLEDICITIVRYLEK